MKTLQPSAALWWATVQLVLALSVPLALASTSPPEQMTYQGFLVDANGVALGNPAPKNYDVVFRIYDAQNAGAQLWAEQQTVTVDKGYFSVLLGEGSQAGSEPRPALSTLFRATDNVSDRFVEVTVKGIGSGTPPADVTIKPRLRLLTSPYAFLAQNAVNLVSGTNQIVSAVADNVGINGGLNVSGAVNASSFAGHGTIPIGGIIMWSGASVPAGWALCDGTQDTPDLRGRFVLGSGSGIGLTTRTIGEQNGSETKTLTVDQMPSHAHTITVKTTGYTASYNGGAESTGAPNNGKNNGWQNYGSAAVGGGQPFSILPPYYVLAYIMRVQ